MREMKDSGMIRLKYVVDIFGRIGFRGYTEQDLVDENEGAITLSPSNIQNMKMDYSKCSFLTWQKYYESPEIKIKNGDVLFVKTGSTYGKVGYVEHLPMEATINPQLVVFKNISMNSKLLFYMLQMSFVKDQCELAVVGGTIPTMSQVKIGNIYIPFPSLAEQQRIAEFLDRECGKIDGLKADIQAQIDTLEQYKRSVITEAVTHGLNPSAPMKECSVSWARQIPQHWKVMPNKHLMTKIKNICPIYKGEDILSLTMYGVIVRDLDAGGKMPSSFDGYQYIKKGNLLMCLFDIDVTPRCIGIIKQNGITSPAYSQFKMKKITNARFYYYYYLMLDYTKELLHLAKNLRHSLTEDQLGAIKQLVPPLEEQQEIADYLDNKCAEIEQIIADKKSQIETLDGYKKSLIYEYVTGKKEVV